MSAASRFFPDGCSRAHLAAEPEIRHQVFAKFSEQLANATPWRRYWLLRDIEREVQSRLHKLAPPEALY